MKTKVKFLRTLIILTISTMITNISAQTIGNPAPDFTLKSIDNQTFTLSKQKGKYVVVFSLGYSCHYCIYSAPKIEKDLYLKYKDYENIVVIGMDVWDGKISDVINFKNSTNITFPLMYSAGSVGALYSTSNDKLLLVDDKGILVHKTNNPAYLDIDNVVDKINDFLHIQTGINVLENESKRYLESFPNPFNNETKIYFYLSESSRIRLVLIDLSGNIVRLIADENAETGEHSINFKREALSSGYYFLKLETKNNIYTRKLIIE